MVALVLVLALIGFGLIGTAILGQITGVDIPEVIANILGILIPFLVFSFGMAFYLITHFWIVLAFIEIGVFGFAMRERSLMKMVSTLIHLNFKVGLFFYEAFHKMFNLAIASVRLVIPTK